MKKLLTLFLVLWCSTAWAVEPINLARSNPYVLGAGVAAGANPCAGYLVCQGFETATTGWDNSESWTEVEPENSIVNPAYTTNPLVGSQSLLLDYNAFSLVVGAYTNFTAQDTVYAYTQFRTNQTISQQVMQIQDSDGNVLCLANAVSADGIRAICNNSATTVATWATNTTYHVWLRYTKGTGVNGICSVGFSENGTEPTSGDNFVSYTSCTQTAQAARVYLGGSGSNNSLEKKYDKVRVKATSIGSNPN